MSFKKSILDPLTCGYAKIAAYSFFSTKTKSPNQTGSYSRQKAEMEVKLEEFKEHFNLNTFEVEMVTFKKFKAIVRYLQRFGKSHNNEKKDVMKFFSLENWKKLSTEEKSKHSLFNCNGCNSCLLHKSKLALFKHFNNVFSKKAKENCLPETRDAFDAAELIITNLDKGFKQKYKQSFSSIIPILSPILERTPSQTQDERNKIGKEFQKELEAIYSQSAVERLASYIMYKAYMSVN